MSCSHSATNTPASWTELATRKSDGLTVSLFWQRTTGAVKVTVEDPRLEDFELHVGGADALAAFNHPFAFAAAQGLAFGADDRETSDLQPQI